MQILIIAGNVGKDAVLRRTQDGEPVLGFSLAVDNGKDKDGNPRAATWFDCSIWGKRAEALETHGDTDGLRVAACLLGHLVQLVDRRAEALEAVHREGGVGRDRVRSG